MPPLLIHASCVAIGEYGVLLTGESGTGKSDVALRLIDSGAELVADDQTLLNVTDGKLTASAPVKLAGMMEVRHIGLFRLPYRDSVPVRLYVDLLAETASLERLPEPEQIILLDRPVWRLRLPGYAASTPAKIHAALLYEPIAGGI
jgi:serine kinase of HPr protein (carbohydrate metabolism regulator)